MSDGPCYIGCIGRQGTNGIRQIVDIVAGTVSHDAALSLKFASESLEQELLLLGDQLGPASCFNSL